MYTLYTRSVVNRSSPAQLCRFERLAPRTTVLPSRSRVDVRSPCRLAIYRLNSSAVIVGGIRGVCCTHHDWWPLAFSQFSHRVRCYFVAKTEVPNNDDGGTAARQIANGTTAPLADDGPVQLPDATETRDPSAEAAEIEMDHVISNANTVYGLDHVTNIMKFHTAYLETFLSLQEFIIYGEGPLPIQYRHYIAIMAAGRHKCTYLINFHKKQFLEHNGDPNWLIGLTHVPRKLRNLYEINKILAHRPWLVTKEDIKKIVKGPNSWSMSDLGHAIILLVHFHSLCSFVFACNLNDEIPRAVKVTGVYFRRRSKPCLRGYADESVICDDEGLEPIVERMKKLSEPATEQERIQRYELVQSQLCDSDTSADNGLDPDVKPFVEDSGYSYLDCSRRQFAQQSSFILQEFSWDHHGYSLINRLFNDIGLLLDKKFKTAYNMTYYTMGGRPHIDTSRFRRAIWNYIYCIYGMRNDDYDYEDVTQLLRCQLRVFVKTATCYPERLNKTTSENTLKHFDLSEKIHINLMIMEARMQSELLFALRAVMNYML